MLPLLQMKPPVPPAGSPVRLPAFVAEIMGTMPTSNLSPTAVRTFPVTETTAIIIAQAPSASWGMISF